MPTFEFDGLRLAYSEFGGGPAALTPSGKRGRTARSAARTERTVVLLHGLMLSQRMHIPLAEALAARGNRVITLDLLGHGESDQPRDMWRYSMSSYGEEILALLDHLEIDQAVVGGTSLGANAALEFAAAHPERLRGLVIEMPVLDNGLLGSAIAFTPLLVSLTFGEPIMRFVARIARAVPSRLVPFWGDVALDTIRREPGPGGALLQGLFFGRIAPPRSVRRMIKTRTLIIGHERDPIHPFSDADMLAEELENSRLVQASSIIELRRSPERLTAEIAAFLDEAFKPAARRPRTRSVS